MSENSTADATAQAHWKRRITVRISIFASVERSWWRNVISNLET
jgi:hypothetical protein